MDGYLQFWPNYSSKKATSDVHTYLTMYQFDWLRAGALHPAILQQNKGPESWTLGRQKRIDFDGKFGKNHSEDSSQNSGGQSQKIRERRMQHHQRLTHSAEVSPEVEGIFIPGETSSC